MSNKDMDIEERENDEKFSGSEPEAESDSKPIADDIDEEEAEESDEDNPENDNYEFDDFVVDDNVEEEEVEEEAADDDEKENEEAGEKKKKKKHRSKEEFELTEDDLELVQENKRKTRRLRKARDTERDSIEEEKEGLSPIGEEEADDFIAHSDEEGSEGRDFEEEEGEERVAKKKKKKKTQKEEEYREYTGESRSILRKMFGSDFYDDKMEVSDEEREGEEEEQMAEEPEVLKQKIKALFDPGEIEERYATVEDEKIIATDIPERLQLRFRNRELPDNNELVQETNWIYDKIMTIMGHTVTGTAQNVKKNIMKVLELLRINNLEIMYIFTYKFNEIGVNDGALKIQHLWAIYDLDLEWSEVYNKKKLVEHNFQKLAHYQPISKEISGLISNSQKYTLDNLLEYCEYQFSKYPEMLTDQNQGQYKKIPKRLFIQPRIREIFEEFAKRSVISPDQFVQNLMEGKQLHVPPEARGYNPEKMAANYVDPEQPKIKDVLTFFTNFCKYMAHELFKNPFIRKSIQPLYYTRITLCTEPTPKGKTEIDMYNINYPVKRIHMRPLSHINNEIWLLTLENEQKGLAKIKFVFPWHNNSERDEILRKLQDLFLAPITETAEKDNISQWNILRKEIITLLLAELYPHYEKTLREELKSEGERYLIEYCGQHFRKMIFAAPYPKSVDEDNPKSGAGARVLSFVPEQTGAIQLAMVDGYGELLDHMMLNYFLINLNRAPEEFKVRNSAEKEQLKKFVARYRPDLIVVGTSHLNAKMVRQVLRDQQEGEWETCKNTWITFGDMTAARIYAKSEISNKEFKEYNLRLREAISLARLQQNPLAEILRLWNDRVEDNGLMQITFHHLQVRLKNEYEKVSMEVCNSVGFDINKALQHRHLTAPLQFICGLGPRKSHHVIEKIIEKFEKLRLRLELFTFKIVEKNVYMNMCGFIIVHNYDEEDEFDLLDTTRIHPENYQLAKKIAKDALDEAYDDRNVDHIQRIMDQPHKLEELDLEDYAAHLESKGKHNMKYVFDFIVMELTRPFADPRGARKEMDQKDLFYKLTKETPFSLQYGMIVTCRVVRVDRKSLLCRLECGVDATIAAGDIYDNEGDKEKDLRDDFKEGMVLKARVKKLSFENSKANEGMSGDFTRVQLTIRPKELAAHKKYLKFIHHSDIEESFKIKEDEDLAIPVDITTKGLGNKYKMRKINHLKFKNISYQGALDYLADKEVGDFVIRPSSKGDNHLTITWKFYENIYVHLDIKEGIKAPNEQIAKRLSIGNETFDGLEEIVLGYINPCNNIVNQVINHRKFDKGDFDLIESKLKKEKEIEPKIIPYLFSFSSEAPQYLILSYIPKAKDVVREYIKIKPKGLVFHDQIYTNLNTLIAWFKANYKNQEYHKYLKHAKVPIAPRTSARGDKAESGGLDFVKADDGTFKVKEDRTAIKKEPNFNPGSQHNWDDNDRRSFSRGRSIDQDRNRSMSKSRGTPFKGDNRRDRRPGESPGAMSWKSRNDNRASEARSPWTQDSSRQRDRSSQREWDNQSERSRASRDFSTGRGDRGGQGGGRGGAGGRDSGRGGANGGRDRFENKGGRYEKGGRSDSNVREKRERSRSKSWEKDKKAQRGNKDDASEPSANKASEGSENWSFIINNSNPKSSNASQDGWTQGGDEIDY